MDDVDLDDVKQEGEWSDWRWTRTVFDSLASSVPGPSVLRFNAGTRGPKRT
jgi:hypothetical protein